MPKKPTSFDDIVGHRSLITFLQEHLEKDTLPQFIIFEGDEGIGKTSIAKIIASQLVGNDSQTVQRVIQENKSTEAVLLYNMSINGGKDAAKEVEANLGLGISGLTRKVIILDEAHGLSEAAQDVFLVSTEYLQKGVYLFMCTTDSLNLKPTLKSRALTLHLNHLSQAQMTQLLTEYAKERNLRIQAEASTIRMIAQWADGKPRIALNLLEGFSPGSSISADTIKEFVDFLDAEDILPLLSSLHGSMSLGLSYISEMKINSSFVPLLVEILKVKMGAGTYRLSISEVRAVREQLKDVPIETLVKFIYKVSGLPRLTRTSLISAFLQCHADLEALTTPLPKKEIIEAEMSLKREASDGKLPEQKSAPTLDMLLSKGVVLN